MKIEVGKKYKTRNNRIVVIHSVSRQAKDGRTIVGELVDDPNGFITFFPNGRVWTEDPHQWDLVSEIKEKLKVTFHMDMPEDFKGLTADEIETKLREVFTDSMGKIKVWTTNPLKGFICDDVIVSGMTEE